MTIARTIIVADAFAAELRRFLQQLRPAATVTREYAPKIDDEAFAAWIETQKPLGVSVVPVMKKSRLETRGSDLVSHAFGVIFAEKCTEPGIPSNDWMDARVGVVDACDEAYGDLRRPLEFECGRLKCVESEIKLIFDPQAYREHKAFWSLWSITYEESRRACA